MALEPGLALAEVAGLRFGTTPARRLRLFADPTIGHVERDPRVPRHGRVPQYVSAVVNGSAGL
jgi:hypothetical protein